MSDTSVSDSKREESIDMKEVVVDGSSGIYRPEVDISQVDEKKLMRKIDLRLVPWLALLYLMNSLDRGSIGNARVRTRILLQHLSAHDLRSCMEWRRT